MQFIKTLYKNILPDDLRWQIWNYRTRNSKLGILRKKFLEYYETLPEGEKNSEVKEVVAFVKKYSIVTFPYPFIYNYNIQDVEVYRDKELDLPYVLLDGKKLYYKRSWPELAIKENFNFLSIEQDLQSPHRYLTDAFQVTTGDVVADIGAAEGNFGLSVIEKISKLYIFETDSEWIESLSATFSPWKEKVEIVNRYVSDVTDKDNITIDDFVVNRQSFNFLKIDTEGAEAKVLKGAAKELRYSSSLKVAICTYHKQNDQHDLAVSLEAANFNISYSSGYMFFLEDNQTPPYLRRGLIRATKGRLQ
ncbi:FkbM family methyltransferase [Pontibacter sp. HJ8]